MPYRRFRAKSERGCVFGHVLVLDLSEKNDKNVLFFYNLQIICQKTCKYHFFFVTLRAYFGV